MNPLQLGLCHSPNTFIPVSLEYFIHLESLGLQLVDYWFFDYWSFWIPQWICRFSTAARADSGASADFEAADCAASPRSLSSRAWAAWCVCLEMGIPWYTGKKKTNNLAKYRKIWWFILIYFKRKPHETWHLFSLHNWRNHPFDDVETSLDHLVLEPLRHVQPNLVFIILSHCHESVAQNVGNKIHLGQFLASVHLVFCRWQHPIIQSA